MDSMALPRMAEIALRLQFRAQLSCPRRCLLRLHPPPGLVRLCCGMALWACSNLQAAAYLGNNPFEALAVTCPADVTETLDSFLDV